MSQIDGYLQIDGIKGESTDSKHVDWIEITSFSHTIDAPVSTATGSGAATAQHTDFQVGKLVDLSSPTLYSMCATGKHIPKVIIELQRASGSSQVKYLSVEMDDAVISRAVLAAAQDVPAESISFSYGKIQWTYTQQKPDGSAGGNVTGGWDVSQTKAS